MSLFFEEETSSVPKNPILAFIDNLKEKEAQKQKTHEQEKDHEQKQKQPISQSSNISERRDNQEKQVQKPKLQLVLEPFDYNRKPVFRQERDIIFAYSINEMLALQESSIADELNMENCRSKLPIKSFWRLKARNSNNSGNANNNNVHNKSNAGNYGNFSGNYGNTINGNNKYRNSRYGAEDNNVDGKTRKQRNRRRRSQVGGANSGSYENRQDDNLENDIELLKVEQGLESTGNAMQDFENWKSKMKEIERKKKGLPPMEAESDVSFNHQSREQQKPDIMADFFNLNSSDTQLSDALEPSSTDNSKKGSSRFSSFFNEPSGSPLASAASLEKLGRESELKQQQQQPQQPQQLQQQQKPQQSQNSKMLSFFNNQTPEQAQRPMSPQVNLHAAQPTNQQHQSVNFPPGIPMPEGQPPVGQGNFFFEKLLTKNKMELQTPVPTGSPSQSNNVPIHNAAPMQNLPVNGHPQRQHQNQHQPQRVQGQHAHMPQGGFMPPYFQMPPQQQIQNQFQQNQGGQNSQKGASNQHLQFQQGHPMGPNDRQNSSMHPMMYGVPPPPFMQNGMPPQGFPGQGFPPQGFPPNGANVQKAPNGMPQGMPPMYQNQMMHPNFQNRESR